MPSQPENESDPTAEGHAGQTTTERVSRSGRSPAVAATIVAVIAAVGWLVVWGDDSGSADDARPTSSVPIGGDREDRVGSTNLDGIPRSLLAAESYAAQPGASTLRELLTSIGGLDAVTVGTASGAFDVVTFDPLDTDRILAAVRSSYGEAENQHLNEEWRVGVDGVTQRLWAPADAHDFAHFNRDGTITVWVRAAGPSDFAPRNALLIDPAGERAPTSAPLYASRFSAGDGAVFALTGDGDYYSNDGTFQQLVADDGLARTVLDSGDTYAWIDNPVPGFVVAYPLDSEHVTAVWNTATLSPAPDHPLAGRRLQRVAVSGDGATAVGVNFNGRLERIDLDTGDSVGTFGGENRPIDPRGIDHAITVNEDGTVAVTVERSGLVTQWWVDEGEPIVSIVADAAQPRWVAERFAARSSSAVAPDASRVAIRAAAQPGVPITWSLVDLDVGRWVDRACGLAGRSLLPAERVALDLPPGSGVCR